MCFVLPGGHPAAAGRRLDVLLDEGPSFSGQSAGKHIGYAFVTRFRMCVLQVATLQRLDAGAMYFWMKDLTQEFLKLSIIYSSVEIFDKARCCSSAIAWRPAHAPDNHSVAQLTDRQHSSTTLHQSHGLQCTSHANGIWCCRSCVPSESTRWRRWRPPAPCMPSATDKGTQLELTKVPFASKAAGLLCRDKTIHLTCQTMIYLNYRTRSSVEHINLVHLRCCTSLGLAVLHCLAPDSSTHEGHCVGASAAPPKGTARRWFSCLESCPCAGGQSKHLLAGGRTPE